MSFSRILAANWIALPLAAVLFGLTACTPTKTREQAARDFEEAVLAEEGTRDYWLAVKADFPDDFDILVKRGVDAELAGTLTQQAGVAIGKDWLAEFEDEHSEALKFAPDNYISALLDSTIDLMVTFENRDQKSCARLAIGETFDTSKMSLRVQNAVQRNKVDQVRAMAAGQKKPKDRDDPSNDDFLELHEQMRALGANERIMQIMSDEKKLMAASARDQCSLGVLLYRAMDQMPKDKSAKLGAFLLSPADE